MEKKFKVGDKVKIPKSKSKGVGFNLEQFQEHLNNLACDYLIVETFFKNGRIKCEMNTMNYGKQFWDFGEIDLEHYEEEFILPEKWCVEVTRKNKDILSNWLKQQPNVDESFYEAEGWIISDLYHDRSHQYYGKHAKDKGYTEITFELFEEYILKKETMEKNIVGYKLIKPEYAEAVKSITGVSMFDFEEFKKNANSFQISIANLKKAGVLDLWFEPVYENEFKIGDWVTCKEGFSKTDSGNAKNENRGGHGYETNKTFQIEAIYNSPNSGEIAVPFKKKQGVYFFALRKATSEEIKAVQTTIIKMYSSNNGEFEIEVIDGKAFYRPENKELPKEWVGEIISEFETKTLVTEPYNIVKEIKEINVGCFRGIIKEDLQKLYRLLK